MIKQVYIPYWEWEDYINGMWRRVKKCDEQEIIDKCIIFTGNHILYGLAMSEVIEAWPRTMLHNLSNKNINRKAFLGHCAVQYKLNIPEYITRIAWGQLTEEQRFLANNEALKNIKHWENEFQRKNKQLYKGLGTQMLLQWHT